jgi:pimeloyl-ACP methyl ester carboxylesterase
MSTMAKSQEQTPGVTSDRDGQGRAPNRSVEVGGNSLVYRRFGNKQTDAPPLVCLQHFRGNLDNWDPALVDRLAEDREVILLANRGVGASTGIVPDNVTDMTRDVLLFADALELEQIDVLGFSLGGYIAQELALVRPRLVRRIVLAGTAPQGAPGIHRWTDDVYALATPDVPSPGGFVSLFFSGSEESRAKGMEYLKRITAREVDRDDPTDLATRDAQLTAITRWGIPDPSKLSRLAAITQPTFVANGERHDDDHREQPPARPPPAERPATDLSRLGSRLPGSIPRAIRRPRQGVSQRALVAWLTTATASRPTTSGRWAGLGQAHCASRFRAG